MGVVLQRLFWELPPHNFKAADEMDGHLFFMLHNPPADYSRPSTSAIEQIE